LKFYQTLAVLKKFAAGFYEISVGMKIRGTYKSPECRTVFVQIDNDVVLINAVPSTSLGFCFVELTLLRPASLQDIFSGTHPAVKFFAIPQW